MSLVDTHCHIHESSYPLDMNEVLARARLSGVGKMICVGTSEKSSREAVEFAQKHENVFASIGVHPHDTKDGWGAVREILESLPVSKQADFRHEKSRDASLLSAKLAPLKQSSTSQEASRGFSGQSGNVPSSGKLSELRKLVAIGEIGLDYFYTHSPRDVQILALEAQIDLALRHNLPIIFHVREAFDDFWPIFDNFHGIRGELHSFTDSAQSLEEGLKRGLYIGVNGISTFTKDSAQQEMFTSVPLDKMLLETDAPFLTPVPFRGKVNEPAFVEVIAEHHARIRGLSVAEIAEATTANAHALFALS